MRHTKLLFLFIFNLFVGGIGLVLSSPCNSLAAGYGIYEWSARGNALGGTLVGRADDPSAVAFNPAGIVQLEGTQAMSGLSLVIPNSDITVQDPYTGQKDTFDGKFNVWTIPHLYLTKQLSDHYWFGLGVFSRTGLGTEYKDKKWWGRYNNTYTGIKQAGVNPNLAFRLNDKLSLAVGLELSWLDFEHKKTIDSGALLAANPLTSALVPRDLNNPLNTIRDATIKIHGDTIGYGGNIALRYKPVDWLALGLSYRTKISMTVNGKASINLAQAQDYLAGLPAPVAGAIRSTLTNCDVDGTAPIPELLSAGLTFFPTQNLSLEFDAVLTRWSSYKSLVFEFHSPLGKRPSIKDWKDSWRFQVGAEYALSEALDLRASYVFDQSPVQDDHVDYIVPANNRHLIGFGVGYHRNNWSLDLGYTYLLVESRNVSPRLREAVLPSRFHNGMSHITSLSFTYKF